jgi:hypothetical protein
MVSQIRVYEFTATERDVTALRSESATYIKPICAMCLHYSDKEGRCEQLNFPMVQNHPACFGYEEFVPF